MRVPRHRGPSAGLPSRRTRSNAWAIDVSALVGRFKSVLPEDGPASPLPLRFLCACLALRRSRDRRGALRLFPVRRPSRPCTRGRRVPSPLIAGRLVARHRAGPNLQPLHPRDAAIASSSAGIAARSFARPAARLLARMRSRASTGNGLPSTSISIMWFASSANEPRPLMKVTTSNRSPITPPSCGGRIPKLPEIQIPPTAAAASPIRWSDVDANQRSMSSVLVFAPCRRAALRPTTTNSTPRLRSSSRNARSASVKAKGSAMLQSRAQAFGRCLLEVAENVIHAARIYLLAFGDRLRFAPQALIGDKPSALVFGQCLDLGTHLRRKGRKDFGGNLIHPHGENILRERRRAERDREGDASTYALTRTPM